MSLLRATVFYAALGLLCFGLLACRSEDQPRSKPKTPAAFSEEVVLSPDSPKREYIKETVLELVPRPLMEPITGTLAYDQTHTVRVSSPISGRVVGPIAPLGMRHERVGLRGLSAHPWGGFPGLHAVCGKEAR